MSAPTARPAVAVLRLPRYLPQTSGRHVVTRPDTTHVLTLDVGRRGAQVDVTGADGAPLGRMSSVDTDWTLTAPFSGEILADAAARGGAWVSVAAGPPASVRGGKGEEWDLVWRQTLLLRARRPPRREAPLCLDVEVFDATFTPVVVAFVVHVRRMWHAAEAKQQVARAAAFGRGLAIPQGGVSQPTSPSPSDAD